MSVVSVVAATCVTLLNRILLLILLLLPSSSYYILLSDRSQRRVVANQSLVLGAASSRGFASGKGKKCVHISAWRGVAWKHVWLTSPHIVTHLIDDSVPAACDHQHAGTVAHDDVWEHWHVAQEGRRWDRGR